MKFTDEQIGSIVDRVVSQIKLVPAGAKEPVTASDAPRAHPGAKQPAERAAGAIEKTDAASGSMDYRGTFDSVDAAVKAATRAFTDFKDISLEQRKKIIERIRVLCRENVQKMSQMARDETGLGRVEDKVIKNLLAINKTPGVEDIEPLTFTGDHGFTLLEKAPWGVIGSITPCTNPTETIINNGISMIAGGNTVMFNPHPTAKKISMYAIDLLNRAVMSEGGPPNLFTTVAQPTIKSAQELMQHRDIRLLVVTGGPAVVGAAMKTGKRVVAAGPGNPPVVVDETADMAKAARDIVRSSSCDNNIICVIEKEIIATEKAAEPLKKALLQNHAYELSQYNAKRLEKIIVDNDHPNKDFVGKDIQFILKQIGIDVAPDIRMAIVEAEPNHPFAKIEMLMPVVPFIRTGTIDQAIDLAYELEGGRFHTAAIHSKNIDHMHKMAVRMNTSIFVKNGMALAGLGLEGEGPASFTIASPTGEGVTTARHFTKLRRCVVSGYFRII
ncbi:MAG: aldehyde dehydrogenase EutE [Deltaproteobacteria bacterium]|nr:aldehyde dehydrogenase EutE [Deltaproteobacteria bacterium]